MSDRYWDDAGMFRPERIEKVNQAILNRLGLTCQVCKRNNGNWELSEGLASLSGFDRSGTASLTKGIMVVVANCASCGHVHLFRTDKLFSFT